MLEEAFIAAYLVGVRDFGTPDLRVLAARIMDRERPPRTRARPRTGRGGRGWAGPITKITGVQGAAEPAAPPNGSGYERTLRWTNISQAGTALTPFADVTAAGKAGFDTTKPYRFNPLTPHLPEALGAFTHSSADGQTEGAAAIVAAPLGASRTATTAARSY
ncbi:MAG TPA: hypothetical protein VHV75_11565 [Solirubrobacteraceae bacterium]|jgi:hypothetical protein|nr:hypothetical protein [Solirubrobacteraceae bacterium]